MFDDDIPTGESQITSSHLHPVVFRWKGSGERVFLSGSYDNWQTKIPLVRRLVLINFNQELNVSVSHLKRIACQWIASIASLCREVTIIFNVTRGAVTAVMPSNPSTVLTIVKRNSPWPISRKWCVLEQKWPAKPAFSGDWSGIVSYVMTSQKFGCTGWHLRARFFEWVHALLCAYVSDDTPATCKRRRPTSRPSRWMTCWMSAQTSLGDSAYRDVWNGGPPKFAYDLQWTSKLHAHADAAHRLSAVNF